MTVRESVLELEVQVFVFREGESWIAQGLNYDLTGHGQSLNASVENFWLTLLTQIVVDVKHGDEPLANVKPAPKYYWQKLQQERARRYKDKKTFSLPEEVPPAYQIAAEANMAIAA